MSPLMQVNGHLTITLKSALLIGGQNQAGSTYDVATARDASGEVLLPASAIKGACREACVRLARAYDMRVCSLGGPCGDATQLCVICQLFGAPGPDRPGLILAEDELPQNEVGHDGGLRFADGSLRGDPAHMLSLRPSVSIDRATGAARDGLLAMAQVATPPGGAAPILANLTGQVSKQAWALFAEALQLVDGIGRGRTRGLGEVEVRFDPTSPAAIQPPSIAADVAASQIAVLRITAREPLTLGRQGAGSIHYSERRILGSTLRGAIAAALLRAGVRPEEDVFQKLFVDPTTCLRFSDALLAQAAERGVPLPLPLSTLTCKRASAHDDSGPPIYHDTLLVEAMQGALIKAGGVPRAPRCPICDGSLQHEGGTYPRVMPKRRFVTRLARDPRTGTGVPAMLYSLEQILPGTSFVATVSGISEEAIQLLGRAGPIYLGQGRSKGQGLVTLALDRAPALVPAALRQRWQRFAEGAAPLLHSARRCGAAELPEDPRDLIAVVARTDLHLHEDELAQRIFGAPCAPLWRSVKHEGRGGWDQGHRPLSERQTEIKPRPRPFLQVFRAGSVWLFPATPGRPTEAHLHQLERDGLEVDDTRDETRRGRHLGLGQVIFFPDVLLKQVTRPAHKGQRA